MAVLYISSAGISASKNKGIWEEAKAAFRYDESIVFCSEYVKHDILRFADKNTNIVLIRNPYNGMEDFTKAAVDIISQVIHILDDYTKKGDEIEEIIINSSGGTEKMSLIINDVIPFIRSIHQNVTQIWSSNQGYRSIFTLKPKSESDRIADALLKFRNIRIRPADSVCADAVCDPLEAESVIVKCMEDKANIIESLSVTSYVEEDGPLPASKETLTKEESKGMLDCFFKLFKR